MVVVTLRCLVLFFCEIKHFILEVEFLIKSSAGNSSTKICYFLRKSSVQAKKTCSKGIFYWILVGEMFCFLNYRELSCL